METRVVQSHVVRRLTCPTRGVHGIVKMVRLSSVPGKMFLIVVVLVVAVVHVGQLGLECVEPLPVVDRDGDGEGHDEDGDDDPDCRPCTSAIFRSAEVRRRRG